MILSNITVLGVNYDNASANCFNPLIPYEATIIPIINLDRYNFIADKTVITFSHDYKKLQTPLSVYSSISLESFLKPGMVWTDNPYEADVLAFPEGVGASYTLVDAIICKFPDSGILNVYDKDYHVLPEEQVLYKGPCALTMSTFLIKQMADFACLRKPIYQISKLLSLYESPEFDLTEESCNSIIDMLLSKDEETNSLGLQLIRSSNVIKFKETAKALFFLKKQRSSYDSDSMHELSRFARIIGSDITITKDGVYCKPSDTNDEDWALFQKVQKRMIDCGYRCPSFSNITYLCKNFRID